MDGKEAHNLGCPHPLSGVSTHGTALDRTTSIPGCQTGWISGKFKPTGNTWVFPKKRSTSKSSILIGFFIINHPFWGTPIFGNTYILLMPPPLRQGLLVINGAKWGPYKLTKNKLVIRGEIISTFTGISSTHLELVTLCPPCYTSGKGR